MSDYDYVIVGAGSAGCVLANRLSAAAAEVLLDRGRPPRPLAEIKIPAAFAKQFQTKLDWDYGRGPSRLRRPRALRSRAASASAARAR